MDEKSSNDLGNQTGEPQVGTPVAPASETPVYTNPNPIAPEVEGQETIVTENVTPVMPAQPVTAVPESAAPVPQVTSVQEPVPPVQAAQPTQGTSDNTNYTYGNQANHQQNGATSTPNVEDEYDRTPMEMKDWVLTILVALIPCCGNIILYAIWASSKKGNINRRNFCRAGLIFLVIIQIFISIYYGMAFLTGFAEGLSYY